jgi:multiple sugar transport system ATP-binding protein
VADLLRIGHLLARRPQQLSGGEQQRVALGRALVRDEPRAFLMDEPLTNLDVKLRVEMRAELRRLHSQLGKTFLYVTNDQVEAMSMADTVAVLNLGRIQQIGTPDEIYHFPENRFVATFIGSSRMNLLPCRSVDGLLHGEGGWQLPAPQRLPAVASRELELGVRPENLHLDGADSSADSPGLDGTVYAVEPLGDRTLVDVEIGKHLVKVKALPTVIYAIGAPVRLRVDLDRLHIFDRETGEAIARHGEVAEAAELAI